MCFPPLQPYYLAEVKLLIPIQAGNDGEAWAQMQMMLYMLLLGHKGIKKPIEFCWGPYESPDELHEAEDALMRGNMPEK